MRLFFICYTDNDGENHDMMVEANTPLDAWHLYRSWLASFLDQDGEDLTVFEDLRVFEVNRTFMPGMLKWHSEQLADVTEEALA